MVRKSRNTWSTRQIWPWSTERSKAKANRVLPREHIGHSKYPLPTIQETTTHRQHQMVNTEIRLIIFFATKDGETLYNQQKQDCGSDNELLIAKFRLKLKKVGKTTRPFRYNQNQILYDYTVEVTNRFKGLDLIRVPEELWTEVHGTVRESVIKTIPKKKKCKKVKSPEKALQIAEKRREAKGKGENKRYTHLNTEFQRIARRYKKAFPSDQHKEIEGKNRDLFKKIRDTKGTFHVKMGPIKDRNGMDRGRRY